MKNVKYTFAALALFAITATATFAASKTEVAKTKTMQLDCWRNLEDVNETPPDTDQQAQCPSIDADCCFKEEGGLIVGYAQN